ncbi:BlaI/MecI/CopY family transcriptional regulator [Patulibacter sp. NPDC049589]|uniref:BlaI/MecI/CopY family transcriptional regulator n=1 Tax=Patulibacter sp. NPDC049589 TaxID=3154731 RepID=UPI00341361E5
MVDGAIQGELQEQIMLVLWRREQGTVEDVRADLPPQYQGAYTTVATVLNRLVDRGLLGRERLGRTMTYTPTVTEAQYLSRSIAQTLAGASTEAREVALAELIGTIDEDELAGLQEQIRRRTASRADR